MALCNVTGTLYLPDGSYAANYHVFLTRTDNHVVADYQGSVVPQVVRVQADENGLVDFNILTGSYHGFASADVGRYCEGFSFNFAVPDAPAALFEDCIDAIAPDVPPPEWLQRVEQAVADAEAAAALASSKVDEVSTNFVRRDFITTRSFNDGLGIWVSGNPQATMSNVGGDMYITSNVSGGSAFINVTEGTGFPIPTRGVSRVKFRVMARYAPRAGSASAGQFRVVIGHANSSTSTSGIPTYGPTITLTQTTTAYEFEIAVNGSFGWFRPSLQLMSGVNNDFIFTYIEAVNIYLIDAIDYAKEVMEVDSRDDILQKGIGDSFFVYDRSTGLTYKKRTTETIANAPVTMADGTVLVPAYDADIRMWGAIPDGQTVVSPDNLTVTHSGTQSWPAIMGWLRWCMANDRTAILPEGKFFVTNEGETAFRSLNGGGTGSIRIKGAGMDKSQILWRDYRGLNGLGRLDFLQFLSMYNIIMEDFGVIGDWRHAYVTTDDTVIPGGHIFSGNFVNEITLRNVELSGSHFFAFAVGGGRKFSADYCRVNYCLRDGLHCNATEHFQVSNCDFYRVFDDAIASHIYEVPNAGKPYAPEYQVFSNRLRQCQGIALLGASRGEIHSNYGRDVYTRFIATDVATQTPFALRIHDNYCENILDQQQITGLDPQHGGGRGSIGILIGTVNVDAGGGSVTMGPDANGHWTWESNGSGVAKPYDRIDGFYPERNTPPAFALDIRGNSLLRTLEIGRLWSDQEVPNGEQLWCRLGPVDPVITREMVCSYGITVDEYMADVAVLDNMIFGFKRGISTGTELARLGNTPKPNRHLHRVDVSRNRLVNYQICGVQAYGSGVISVVGNTFDGDPLFENPDRSSNGTWGTVNELTDPCIAVAIPPSTFHAMVPSVIFQSNKIANIRRPFSRIVTAVISDNIARGDFVAQSDAANKGIRDLQYHPNRLGTLIYEGSDATDVAGFLKVKHINNRIQDAMPTSGHWIAGTVVDLTVPVVNGSDLVTGYLRLTTGSSHVLGTDWRQITG